MSAQKALHGCETEARKLLGGGEGEMCFSNVGSLICFLADPLNCLRPPLNRTTEYGEVTSQFAMPKSYRTKLAFTQKKTGLISSNKNSYFNKRFDALEGHLA